MKLFPYWIKFFTLTFSLYSFAYSISAEEIDLQVDLNKVNIEKNSLALKKNREVDLDFENIQNEIIKNNSVNIDQLNEIIPEIHTSQTTITEQLLKNSSTIKKHKNRIDGQRKKIKNNYQQQEKHSKNIKILNNTLDKLQTTSGITNDYLDRFWVLIAAVLVFFMQAGFKTFESGMVRKVHEDNVAIKNVLDWLIISLVYFSVGFGFMFGDSFHGLIGTNLFGPTFENLNDIKQNIQGQYLGLEFFLYQLAFAATAATIVSGAMSERTALIPYIFLSLFIGTVIYPIFGHWVWGGTYFQTNQGWLYQIGFRDFAGSTVVHSIGAWVSLAGIIEIGSRQGRFDADGNLNRKDFLPSNLGYSTLGVLILWFGWWGFNGGSQLQYDHEVAAIILNTTLAGSAAGLTAFFHALTQNRDKYEVFPKLLGGILGGLVAITACCNSVSSWEAIFIGAIAGLVHNYSHDYLLLKLKIDDPVGAVAVHGFCGIWGTMSVAFFGDLNSDFFLQQSFHIFADNSIPLFSGGENTRLEQILIQLVGITVAFVFTFSVSRLFFKIIRIIPGIGLRVTPRDEKQGSLLGITY